MNKAELIDAVADAADISKAAAGRSVDTVLEVITDSLKKGNAVTLVGSARSAHAGERPEPGATPVPASRSRSRRRICRCSRLEKP